VAHKFNLISIIAACAAVSSMFTALAQQPTCADGKSLEYYITNYSSGCVVGDKVFSDFTYVASAGGGASKILAGGITVDTLGPTSDPNPASFYSPDIGLQFNTSWAVGPGQTLDSTIGFDVAVVGGASLIKDAAVVQSPSGVSGDGIATVTEAGCGPDNPPGCTPGDWTVFTFKQGSSNHFKDSTTFSTVGSIEVSKDIGLNGNSNGIATISQVQDTFSQIPEPRAMSLLLSLGLLAGLALRKKLQSARS